MSRNFDAVKKSINRVTFLLFCTIALLAFTSCKKDTANTTTPATTTTGTVEIKFSHAVDAAALQFDTMQFVNRSGNKYSVSKLLYYISGIQLLQPGGTPYTSNEIFLLNAADANTTLKLTNVPAGYYPQISLLIGIPAERNTTGGLPAEAGNLAMAWPDLLGGGYHFLRLEGQYSDSNGKSQGFAIHLGSSPMLVHHASLACPLTIAAGSTSTLRMKMNVNEWFCNPTTYDFAKDGNYTMGDTALMKMISNNGKDVFSIQ